MQLQGELLFFIFVEIDIQLREKEKIFGWVLTALKVYSADNYLK